jgi:N-acyl-D-aspartate/D-glutamate deacylase
MLDLRLNGGQLVDGTGAPRCGGDVGIRDGRVVALGDVDEPARRTIDVDGAVVAPGFIDVHTHYDAQVSWDAALTPSSLHGVTTVFAGNCGFSVAPLRSSEADYLMRMLSRVEGMPLSSLQQAVSWDWESTADYLRRVDGQAALNMGFMVGHSAVRRVVMGEESTRREASSAEIEAMKVLVLAGLAAGGMGFSTSLSQAHNDGAGEPVPSRHASFDEIVELAALCRGFDGTSLELVPDAGAKSYSEELRSLMVQMSARAGRTLNWNVLRASADNRDEVEAKLAIADQARAAGGEVVALFMPMPVKLRLNFATGFVLDLLPGWDSLMALPVAEKAALMSTPEGRASMLAPFADQDPQPRYARWEDYLVHEGFTTGTRALQGRTIGDIALEWGTSPWDALCDIAVADDLRTTIGFPDPVESDADWEARARVLADPRVLVGASDAGAHLDMLDTFSYTTSLFEQMVRRRRLLATEEAVRLLTGAPAALYGLRERGVLREGAWADVVVFDEDRIGTGPLHTRSDLPGGAQRLFAEANGVSAVVVNGVPVVVGGVVADVRPGRVLRSGIDTHSGPRDAAARTDT